MILTSPSFNDGEAIPRKFTCEGGNINPELLIQNVPRGAKSLALIMHDPDEPREGGFTHWVAWNISPETGVIKQESVPPGSREGLHSKGGSGYVGPCPPPGHGAHCYEFRLYAVDATFDLPETTGRKELEAALEGHVMERALLTGIYERPAEG